MSDRCNFDFDWYFLRNIFNSKRIQGHTVESLKSGHHWCQKKCPLYRDVRFIEIFSTVVWPQSKAIRSSWYCPSYRGVRFIVCPLYRDSTVVVFLSINNETQCAPLLCLSLRFMTYGPSIVLGNLSLQKTSLNLGLQLKYLAISILLKGWSGTRSSYSHDPCLYILFLLSEHLFFVL